MRRPPLRRRPQQAPLPRLRRPAAPPGPARQACDRHGLARRRQSDDRDAATPLDGEGADRRDGDIGGQTAIPRQFSRDAPASPADETTPRGPAMSTHEQPTRLLLIRHGHHDSGGRFLQHACSGLTDTGVAQAEALAARLASDNALTSAVVLASNAQRSITTAEILAAALGAPVAERTCDLCEMHPGAAEGLTQEEMARRYGPSYRFVPGAEYFPDWLPRIGAALARIAATYRGRRILAVTHFGVIAASFVALGGMPPPQASYVRSENTGITEWWSSPAGDAGSDGPWQLARHNDAAHLESLRSHDSPLS
jgi:broad specificity phosphatase PhoE